MTEMKDYPSVVLNQQWELEQHLHWLNDDGLDAVIIGIDSKGWRFLAVGYEMTGDEMLCGVMLTGADDRAFGLEGDCSECGRHGNRPLDILTFPVRIW